MRNADLEKETDPAAMLVFAAVVREGGFTAAARALGISKQHVSDRVARLEEALGVRLLVRTTRSVRTTDAGERYARACASLAAQIDEANREVREQQQEAAGVVRMSSPSLFGRTSLPPVLAALGRTHPRVRVELAVQNRRVDVVEEGFDLAIRVGPLEDTSLLAKKLGDAEQVFVGPPALVRALGARPTAAALSAARVVGMNASDTWRIHDVTVEVRPWLVAADYDVVCAAAAEGAGLARVPALCAAPYVQRGALAVAFGGLVPARMPIHVVFPHRRFMPLAVRVVVDALVAHGVARPDLRPRAPEKRRARMKL